jgi:hypothetical protein
MKASRSAVTILEIMVAFSLFAVGVMGALAYQFTLSGVRTATQSRIVREIGISNLANLLEGTPWDELGTNANRGLREWSMPTPLAATMGMTIASLRAYGVIADEYSYGTINAAQAWGVDGKDLSIRVEYYRSTTERDAANNPIPTSPGLLEGQRANAQDFKANFLALQSSALLTPGTGTGFSGILTPGDPILIRVQVSEVRPDDSQFPLSEIWHGTATAQ